MNRRNILKGLLVAPVAAKHLGATLTSPGLAAAAALDATAPAMVGGMGAFGSVPGTHKDWLADRVSETKDYIVKLAARNLSDGEAKNIARHCRSRAMQCLDPDLYAWRSMSLSTKIHIQTRRNVEEHYARALEEQKHALSAWIKELAKFGN